MTAYMLQSGNISGIQTGLQGPSRFPVSFHALRVTLQPQKLGWLTRLQIQIYIIYIYNNIYNNNSNNNNNHDNNDYIYIFYISWYLQVYPLQQLAKLFRRRMPFVSGPKSWVVRSLHLAIPLEGLSNRIDTRDDFPHQKSGVLLTFWRSGDMCKWLWIFMDEFS